MKTNPIASSVFALSIFLALMLASAALGDETVLHGRFVRLHDGDSIWVLLAEKEVEIRLAICDTPEIKQAFGARAKEAMRDLVFGKDIEVRTRSFDWDRRVAQITVDGKDVGEELLREGLAWIDCRYIKLGSAEIQESYRKLQEEAKADKRNLWSDPDPIPPWEYRDEKPGQKQTIAWIEAHQKFGDPNTLDARLASARLSNSPLHADDVWVNTRRKGKYWKPGSKYYGKTKRGEYMSEKQAIESEYLPGNGTGE